VFLPGQTGETSESSKKHFFFLSKIGRQWTEKYFHLFHLQMVNYTVPGSTLTTLIIALPLVTCNDTQTVNGNPGAPITDQETPQHRCRVASYSAGPLFKSQL
jgi:hypothetical protein